MKTCRVCGVPKPLDDFAKRKGSSDGRGSCCKTCKRDKYYNPLAERTRQLLVRYRITPERYNDMLREQNGECAICGRSSSPDAKSFAVDHCHSTGRVRGLLCGPCNKAVGLMSDDPELLRLAATYLESGVIRTDD